jgi:hypothetical protein
MTDRQERIAAKIVTAWTEKVDNDPRPPRMKKPVVTPSAHRVYKLYIQDLLQDILVDKYGTKRGTENWQYFVDKGGGAYFAVGQAIQDEKAQMYLDLGERPPADYFAESYYNVWKRWMARSRIAFGIRSPEGPEPKFKHGDTVKTYGGYTQIWSVGDWDDYVGDRRYVVMNPETRHKLNMFEKNIKKV